MQSKLIHFITLSLSYAPGFAKESKRDRTLHTDMSEANFHPILLLYNFNCIIINLQTHGKIDHILKFSMKYLKYKTFVYEFV